MIVTSLPNRWKIDANSQPMTPPPRMTSRRGISVWASSPSESTQRADSSPAISGRLGNEPVAMIADWKLTLCDTVADNASSGAVVLGPWRPYTEDVDLTRMRASLSVNGTEIDSGVGSAVLGDPATAVA